MYAYICLCLHENILLYMGSESDKLLIIIKILLRVNISRLTIIFRK